MKLTEETDKMTTLVDEEIKKYDSLVRDVATSEATLKQFEADEEAVRSNRDMDSKARAQKLQSTRALAELERGDLATLEKSVVAQKAKIIEAGRTARSLGAEIAWDLLEVRRANAKDAIAKLLDLSRVGPINLEIAARSVVEMEDIQYYFSHSGQSLEIDHQIESLRQLRGNLSQLLALCANEPNFHDAEREAPVTPEPVAA